MYFKQFLLNCPVCRESQRNSRIIKGEGKECGVYLCYTRGLSTPIKSMFEVFSVYVNT